jgi:hypothetical protein
MRIYHHLGKPEHLFKEFITNFSAERQNFQSNLVQKLATELLAGDFTFE